MAALPQSNTTRWWLIYSNNDTTHKMLMRTSGVATNTQVSTFFTQLFTAIAGTLNVTTVLGLEKALIGSNVRNPQTYTGTVTFGTGTESAVDGRPRCWSAIGRTTDGRRTRIFMFGVKQTAEGDMRVDTTESTGVASLITFLQNTTGAFLSISGLQPIWKNYVNVGYNDHWIKEYRKG